MNRLKALLITTALITGSSALASAETFNHNWGGQDRRVYEHDRDDRGRYGNDRYYSYGDGDRDDRYRRPVYVDRDHRWRDRDDDDRRWNRRIFDRDHDGDRR